jgi:radical SAM superfamily enzyme YgiQ (UPF0313 family)
LSARARRQEPGQGEKGWAPPRYGRSFHVVLAYPGPYRAGMSSLGFQAVLYGFCSLNDVGASRLFLDEEREGLVLLDAAGDPRQADLIAFSVCAENDYPAILKILALAGLPLRASARDESFPLVIAGGIAPSLNPEPLAEFMDAVVIGEGEEVLRPLVEEVRGEGSGKEGRQTVLERLAAVEGVYVPSLYEPAYGDEGTLRSVTARPPAPLKVVRAVTRDLEAHPAVSRIVAPGSEFGDLFLVEVNRGCGRGCRFCAAGHLIRPLRHRSAASLKAAAAGGAEGLDRIGLLGSAVADHPEILEVMRDLRDRGLGFSVSSLRIDRLDTEFLSLLREGGCRTVTLAPETGGERLRGVVNKRISDDQILAAAGAAAAAGIPNLKLYFMIGLPTETREDREEIVTLLWKVREQVVAGSRKRGKIGTVTASLSCFVPKAWTPFQWHPFAEVKELKAALRHLSKQLGKIPNVKATHDLPKWAYVQALLSRGDRRMAELLESVHRLGGDWGRALRESPLDTDFFVYRKRDESELFPWDFVETGLRRERLWSEYRRAVAEGEGA